MPPRRTKEAHIAEVDEIRRIALVAVFADDELMNRVVLKGGNALSLVYEIGGRASIDLDFSIDGDFEDLEESKLRLFRSLQNRFAARGYHVFDTALLRKPRQHNDDRLGGRWGGYEATFKVIRVEHAEQLSWRPDQLQRQAVAVTEGHHRTFKIDFSKHEYCGDKLAREVDSFRIFVYSPAMLVVEKLRAICQQSPAYELNRTPSPRGRDFYDIVQVIQSLQVDPLDPKNIELLRLTFEAKEVPLALLRIIGDQRDFHAAEWPSVVATLFEKPEEFDVYFDFVLDLAGKLEAAGVIDAPR